MRLLFFSAQYLPTAGGVERYTFNLAKTLVSMGHNATVVTSALPGLPAQETDANGIHILRLPARLFMGGRFPAIRKNRPFKTLAQQLWQTPFDFAVINTRFYPLSVWAAKQCNQHGVPAVVLEHGTKHLSLDNPLLNIAGNAYEHAAMRLVRRHCNAFYGVSKACAAWLQHFHVTARGVLYNAVDAAALDAITQHPPYSFRQKLAIPNNAPLICFIGRFIVEKGVWELLEAFALLQKEYPDAVLVMAGDGPLLAQVRAKQLPGVYLCGALSYPESVSLMAQSDVFCLPTYSEGFSSTILEAAAVGSCIVTTPTGGSPELIENDASGILLSDIRPATIAAAVGCCLSQPGFRAAAGQAARQSVLQNFTWPATAQHLLDVINTQRNDHQ